MLIFDVDGVITESTTGEVELGVIDKIIEALKQSEPVAFNTGRGLSWIAHNILSSIEARSSKKNIMNWLCITYQKGAFWVTFNEEGEQETPVAAPDITLIPHFLRSEVLQLIATKYSETMFPGEEKEAVLSPQFIPGADFAQYKADQKNLVEDLQAMLQHYGLEERFRVDPTRIATDIEDKRLGKALGSQQILAWLKDRGMQPRYYITLGDSKSDIGMADEIYRQGLPVEFVFVGEKAQLAGIQLPFPLRLTESLCEKGTLEYLTKQTYR